MSTKVVRKLSEHEVADLPTLNWENFTEDPAKYHVIFFSAWEVDKDTYQGCMAAGALCKQVDGKYIVAL